MYFIESIDGVEVSEISVKSEVREAYNNIINYYKISKKLPSLTYINQDLKVLYEKFIKSYLDALNDIEEGSYLTKEQKNLFKNRIYKKRNR